MRLCVETLSGVCYVLMWWAAAFVRLCVETGKLGINIGVKQKQPPSCGCVLKLFVARYFL